MSRLMQLSCDCYVAADEVSEVTVNRDANTITVRMKTGVGHIVSADYGCGIYDTCDRLVRKVNEVAGVKP